MNNENKLQERKERMMSTIIHKYGLEAPITIRFCRGIELADKTMLNQIEKKYSQLFKTNN